MSISIKVTITCDACGAVFTGSLSEQETLRFAVDRGWTKVQGKHYCTECSLGSNPDSALDVQAFAEAVYDARLSGLRTTAAQVGVSASTLSRIEHGATPDVSTFIRVCQWLGKSPEQFYKKE